MAGMGFCGSGVRVYVFRHLLYKMSVDSGDRSSLPWVSRRAVGL